MIYNTVVLIIWFDIGTSVTFVHFCAYHNWLLNMKAALGDIFTECAPDWPLLLY